MKRFVDLALLSKIMIALLICIPVFFLTNGMLKFGGRHSDRQVSGIAEVINKALVQCYALEGSYPDELEQIEKYGVVLDNDKYFYYYECYGGNLRPTVIVSQK